MLYHLLYPLNNLFAGFNVFRYITFRTIGAAVTAFLFFVLVAPAFIRFIRNLQLGQVIRDDGPETHLEKEGIPTMGGMLIIFTIINSTLLWANLTNRYVWVILGVTLWFGSIGAIDDFRKISIKSSKGLSARGKLLLQVIILTGISVSRSLKHSGRIWDGSILSSLLSSLSVLPML
jgi:phospho-N-acetylmuramoyl-pentapeptide-transferase